MPIDPQLRAVMQSINKKMGAGTVVLGSEIRTAVRETITSGSLSLDAALGGGWATNHWIEVMGHESVGKTLIVLKTIAANQMIDPNWTTVWFATEDFSESYAKKLGVDLDRVIVVDENGMEDVYEHTIEFLQKRVLDCIVIDSLPGLVPSREEDATMADFQPGLAAFLTGKFFRKSNPSMKRSLTDEEERPCTGFIINQWREKFTSYGDPRTSPGGKAKNFFFYQRVDVQKKGVISNTRDLPIGQSIEIRNLKNKLAPPGRIGAVDAYIADGKGFKAGDYDTVKDMVTAAIAYGTIVRTGKLDYSFGDQHWSGRPKLDAAIKADSKLQSLLRRAVLAAAAAPMPPTEEVVRAKRPAASSVRGTRAGGSKAPAGTPARRKRVGS